MSSLPGLPPEFTATGSASFIEFLSQHAPHVLPQPIAHQETAQAPHGTTIVAATCTDGVVLAGDRQATAGYTVAHREMEKVFQVDEFSAVGIAGTAGLAIELVRLFQLEVEHYEKLEGTVLSLTGKAQRLAGLVGRNFGMALQGFAAIPLFAGFDRSLSQGRIFTYDGAGGRYEERIHFSIGSGAVYARSALRARWRSGLTLDETIDQVLHALWDAADEDTATAGPDIERGIYPTVVVMTAQGLRTLPVAELADRSARIAQQRRLRIQEEGQGHGRPMDDGGVRS